MSLHPDTLERLGALRSNMPRRAALATAAGVAGAAMIPATAEAHGPKRRPFGGPYYVLAEAPYGPHLMTFHDDGTMTSTNPTNVQDGPSASVKVTDSLGMGLWRWDDRYHVLITMVQENANQPARTRSVRLHVSARVKVDREGNFAGPAIAELLAMVDDSAIVEAVVEHPRSYLQGRKLVERFDKLDREDRRYLWAG